LTGERGIKFAGAKTLPRGNLTEDTAMSDLIFVGVIVAFFLLAGLYASFCEKL
jgi:hypothetical protein